MHSFRLLVVISGLFCSIALVQADVLLINSVNNDPSVQRPSVGMAMDQVLTSYGEPQFRGAAIGEPPIIKWDYGKFVVYFENQHVIHAVVPRK